MQLVESLKQNNQDFEFYPTTKEMVEAIYNDAEEGENPNVSGKPKSTE